MAAQHRHNPEQQVYEVRIWEWPQYLRMLFYFIRKVISEKKNGQVNATVLIHHLHSKKKKNLWKKKWSSQCYCIDTPPALEKKKKNLWKKNGQVNATVLIHHLHSKNASCCFEQILEAAPLLLISQTNQVR